MTRILTAVVLAAVALLAGCSVPDATPSAPLTVQVTAEPRPAPAVAPPVRVRIPDLGVDSDLIQTGILAGGRLETPPVDQPEQASAVAWSPRLAGQMPTVILGHVDGVGRPGVFAGLVALAPGALVMVDRGGDVQVYRVRSVESFPKAAFPALRVYSGGPDELRLVTCGGAFDDGTGHYVDNVVVFAELADVR